MKSTWIAAVLAISFLLFAAGYWGYLRGIEVQSSLDTSYIPIVKGLADCHAKRDWDCAEAANKLLSVTLSSQMEVVLNESMVDETVRDDIKAFLEWHEEKWSH